ncbi:MAG: hypothetical protein GXP10_02055 [Gammaproteobacteria bacterium]|nr:hypothetical protein [Gammaproteobacteria bacterium]
MIRLDRTGARRLLGTATLIVAAALLTACSTPTVDERYKNARTVQWLEIPPDLISPAVDSNSGITPAANDLTDSIDAAYAALIVEHLGGFSLLLMEPFEQAWPLIEKQLAVAAIAIIEQNKTLGLLTLQPGGAKDKSLSPTQRLSLQQRGRHTLITVVDEQGQRSDSAAAFDLLSTLQKNLRRPPSAK